MLAHFHAAIAAREGFPSDVHSLRADAAIQRVSWTRAGPHVPSAHPAVTCPSPTTSASSIVARAGFGID